jgi:hypothetical protein
MAELSFKVDIDGNGFAKVQKLSGNFKKADSASQKFAKALKGATAVATAFTGVATAGGVALGAMVKKTLDQIDATTKASRAVGVQTELYTGLVHVAKLGGVEQEKLNGSLKRFARNMNDAEKGIGTGKVAFEQLGVSIKNNQGELKTQENLILDIADKFSELEDGAQKTAIAQDIFGKSGADLINILNGGSEAMREQLESADALGLVFDQELGKKAEYFNDRLTEVGEALKGFQLRAVAVFADSKLFNAFINGFEMLSKTISNFISSEQFTSFLEYTFNLLKDLINPVSAVIATFKALGGVLFNIGQIVVDAVISPFNNLVVIIGQVSEAIGRFIEGDFKGVKDSIASISDGIDKNWEELKNNTITNIKDIGNAFYGIKDDYLSMSEGMTLVATQVNKGFDSMKKSQKAFADSSKLTNDLKPIGKVDDSKLKQAKEDIDKFFELDEKVRQEHRLKTTEHFTFLREQEIADHQEKMTRLLEFNGATEEQETLHKLRMAEIAEKEKESIEKAEQAKRNAYAKTFSIYSQISQNTIGVMQEVFGKNKIFGSAMIISQGAQAVVNALATPPFPLGLSMAALATAKTATALQQLNSSKAFALGGVVSGGEQMIRVNEQGQEAVLNASATRSLGRETIDLLNNGRKDLIGRETNNKPSMVINVNGVLSREVYDNEIKPYMAEDLAFR